MGVEIYVIGREALPVHSGVWSKRFSNSQGSIEVGEVPIDNYTGILEYMSKFDWELGYKPKSIITVRKAWDNAYAVSVFLAQCVNGIVFDDFNCVMKYDAGDKSIKVPFIQDIEHGCQAAFDEPDKYLEILDGGHGEESVDSDFENEWNLG